MLNYIIWLLVGILYSPVFYKLYRSRWEKIDYTHAYFILPISLFFVWQKRAILKKLAAESVKNDKTGIFSGLAMAISGLLMFIFGWRQDYLFITCISLIPVLFGGVIYLYGKNTVKAISFPIFYLLLLVPPPLGILDSVTLPMRYGISASADYTLRILKFPVIREGLLLAIGSHEIYMGPACSGFRSLITMLSLGLAYVYLIKGPVNKKIMLISMLIPLALLGNFIRVISMCLITFYLGEGAGHKFHDYSGFVIFVILILGLIALERIADRLELR